MVETGEVTQRTKHSPHCVGDKSCHKLKVNQWRVLGSGWELNECCKCATSKYIDNMFKSEGPDLHIGNYTKKYIVLKILGE